MTPALPPPELVLVRYGELALKGGNRSVFERALVRNIQHATRDISPVAVARTSGRITVRPERREREVARAIQDVFGIKSISLAWGAPLEPEAIAEVAGAVFDDALADFSPEDLTTWNRDIAALTGIAYAGAGPRQTLH